MGEVRNGDQKVRKYLFPEIFYGRQEVHKYVVLLLILIVGSRSIHYSSFASYKKNVAFRRKALFVEGVSEFVKVAGT